MRAASKAEEESRTITSPAIVQVMNTTELLENILLFLDLHTLLCAKRVSRQFRDVTQRSRRIQKALFLESLRQPTIQELEWMEGHEQPITLSRNMEKLPASLQEIPANPLHAKYVRYSRTSGSSIRRPSSTVGFREPRRFTDDYQKLRYSHDSASWRRMLVIQPHAAPIYIREEWVSGGSVVKEPCYDGLRMADLKTYERTTDDSGFSFSRRVVNLHIDMKWAYGKPGMRKESPNDPKRNKMYEVCGWDILSSR